ncbi:rCG44428 [Rattus norvegicus]|uniref:RCG44428 n=1 Tax=Rattus norvegicus TaxID=10116 RepID=A6I5D3_RAT|nr:rCG44428 [Rattus norvegicus]
MKLGPTKGDPLAKVRASPVFRTASFQSVFLIVHISLPHPTSLHAEHLTTVCNSNSTGI